MKRASIFAFLTVAIGLASLCTLSAQVPRDVSVADRYVISAKAGGVSLVEGTVSVARVNGTAGLLLKRDQVEIGDRVTTGTDGRAEILLNPGSYLRLSKNSSFEFGATDLEDLTIKLSSGSAIFEVFAADEFRVSVLTPKGKVSLVDTGVYRVDVAPDGSAIASVTKGKAEVGDINPVVVKGGRTGTIDGSNVAIAQFDKDKRDDFAQWSRLRSKDLTKTNTDLQDRYLNNALARGFRQGRWGLNDSFGLWLFDARYGGYCFLPYGFGWRSPYGGYYGSGIYPSYVPLTGAGTPTKGVRAVRIRTPAASSVNPSAQVKGSRSQRSESPVPPPFTRVKGGSDGGTFSNGFPPVKSVDNGFPSTRQSASPFPSAAPVRSEAPISISRSPGVKVEQ